MSWDRWISPARRSALGRGVRPERSGTDAGYRPVSPARKHPSTQQFDATTSGRDTAARTVSHRAEVVGQVDRRARGARTGRRGGPAAVGVRRSPARPHRGTWPDVRWRASRRCAPRRTPEARRLPSPSPCGDRSSTPAVAYTRAISSSVAASSTLAARNVPRDPALVLVGLDVEAADGAEAGELLGGQPSVAAVHLEQQPLEVRRHLDVHARAQRRARPRGSIMSSLVDEPGEDVVDVRRDDEVADRRTQVTGDPAGEHVAEVARRHRRR